jgi:hypothetical protein
MRTAPISMSSARTSGTSIPLTRATTAAGNVVSIPNRRPIFFMVFV